MKNARYFIAVLLMGFLFVGNNAYASFPVETDQVEVINVDEGIEAISSPASTKGGDNVWIALALWFFLGWPFAAHRWYAGKPIGWNILFILTLAGLGVWAIVDLVFIITGDFFN